MLKKSATSQNNDKNKHAVTPKHPARKQDGSSDLDVAAGGVGVGAVVKVVVAEQDVEPEPNGRVMHPWVSWSLNPMAESCIHG